MIYYKETIKYIYSTLKIRFLNIKFDLSIAIICLVYGSFFGYHIFTMNDVNNSMLCAIGVDHSMILESMQSMLSLHGFYNQTASFHSSHYGWTFYAISFIFLLPLKLLAIACGSDPDLAVRIGLKVLYLIYAALAGISFYFLVKKITNNFYALLGALILAIASPLTIYNYRFHPETIGILFLNLSCIFLLDFIQSKNKELKDYYVVLFLLTLSTLAKSYFILITGPVYLCLLFSYNNRSNKESGIFYRGLDFKQLILKSFYFFIGIFFFIHPFFFIKILKTVKQQLGQSVYFATQSVSLSLEESIKAWAELIIRHNNLISVSILITISMLIFIVFSRKTERSNRIIYLFMQAIILIYIVFITISCRLFVNASYLIPVVPFLIINLMLLFYIIESKLKSHIYYFRLFSIILLSLLCLNGIKSNTTKLLDFYNYKQSDGYNVYNYIKINVPDGSIIVHDHLVPIPDGKNIKAYNYWPNSKEILESVGADYVIFNPNLKFNNKYQEKTLVLKNIVKNKAYQKIETFGVLEVWKKI